MMGMKGMSKLSLMLSMLPVETVIFLLGLLMPELVRREIFFGIRMPEEYRGREDFIALQRRYRRNFILSSLLYLAFFNILIYLLPYAGVTVAGILGYTFLSFVNYYVIHRRVKEIKQSENWEEGKREVTVIDTGFRNNNNKKLLVSPLWFLIPLALVIFNLILPLSIYDSLPDKLPVRTSNGVITGWQDKTNGVLSIPIISLITTGLLFFVYKTMGWAKQLVSVNNSEASRERNRLYRYRWSGFITFLCIIMVLFFTVINLKVLTIIPFVAGYDWIIYGAFGPIILVGAIAMSIWTGQGGSRIKLPEDKKKTEGVIDRNDDRYWKLGSFYYNPEDPAVWVEKRFGIGMTMNFAKPQAYLFLVAILGLIFLIPLLAK